MKRTVSAGGIVVLDERWIVLVSSRGVSWTFPKGHVKNKEIIFHAALREIKEETGIAKSNLKYIRQFGSYNRFKINHGIGEDKSELKTIHMFLFISTQSYLEPRDPDESQAQAKWVAIDRVADFLTHPKDKEFFLKNFPIKTP